MHASTVAHPSLISRSWFEIAERARTCRAEDSWSLEANQEPSRSAMRHLFGGLILLADSMIPSRFPLAPLPYLRIQVAPR